MASSTKHTQFSKKLTMWIAIFWCIYRLAVLVAAVINPVIAGSIRTVQDGADDVMMAVVLAYNGNSLGEKGFAKYFESKSKRATEDEESAMG